MLEKNRCIVLKTVKYGDRSIIVDVLSREHGRMSVVWRQPKSGAGRARRQYFQILSILDLECERRSASALPTVKDVRFAVPYSSIPFDNVKLTCSFFIAEFLLSATQGEQTDVALYEYVESGLIWYDMADGITANFHLLFMMRASRFLGFYPDMDSYVPNSFFDLRSGVFVTETPLHNDYLKPEEASVIVTLMRMTPATMHLFRLSRDQRNRAVEVILQFYRLHIPSFRDMKTWEVLKEVYGGGKSEE